MSESNSDNKDVIEEAVVKKVTKAKKTAKAKKVEEVVASEVVEKVAVEKEEVIAAPYISTEKKEDASKSYVSYFAIAAGVVFVAILTTVTFFEDEYQSALASLETLITTDEVVSESTVASSDSGQMSDQIVQANYGYQPVVMNQARNNSYNEMRNNQRAAFEESMRQHNQKMAERRDLRTAAFKNMDQVRIDRQKKFEVMREKTQQIQLEMQQKMQAAYNEFHSI
ncbi:MAG: hypothetical protein KAT90_09200 [Gammaproteobacteria bacterium]|nr:hypothetical protein [Gammaproteobacteria bacterium]